MKFGVSEGPTYWVGYHRDGGKIWLIHERFKKESERYTNTGIIFTSGFDDIDSKYFENITRFECAYTSEDRRNMLGVSSSPTHIYREGENLYTVLQRAYLYGFDKYGGCFVK